MQIVAFRYRTDDVRCHGIWTRNLYDNVRAFGGGGGLIPDALSGCSLCQRGRGLGLLQWERASAPSCSSGVGEWCIFGPCTPGGNQLESCR